MKKAFLILLIRLAKMLKMDEKLMPELELLPANTARTGRLYMHYGRVVLSHRNPEKVEAVYLNRHGSPIRKDEYQKLVAENIPCSIRGDVKGRACHLCDFNRLGLPCRCDFASGPFTGYYEVISQSKQYSTNIIRPKIRIDKNI